MHLSLCQLYPYTLLHGRAYAWGCACQGACQGLSAPGATPGETRVSWRARGVHAREVRAVGVARGPRAHQVSGQTGKGHWPWLQTRAPSIRGTALSAPTGPSRWHTRICSWPARPVGCGNKAGGRSDSRHGTSGGVFCVCERMRVHVCVCVCARPWVPGLHAL